MATAYDPRPGAMRAGVDGAVDDVMPVTSPTAAEAGVVVFVAERRDDDGATDGAGAA